MRYAVCTTIQNRHPQTQITCTLGPNYPSRLSLSGDNTQHCQDGYIFVLGGEGENDRCDICFRN